MDDLFHFGIFSRCKSFVDYFHPIILPATEKECTFNYSSPSVQPTALSKVALGGIISGSVLLTGVIICMVVLIARETAGNKMLYQPLH